MSFYSLRDGNVFYTHPGGEMLIGYRYGTSCELEEEYHIKHRDRYEGPLKIEFHEFFSNSDLKILKPPEGMEITDNETAEGHVDWSKENPLKMEYILSHPSNIEPSKFMCENPGDILEGDRVVEDILGRNYVNLDEEILLQRLREEVSVDLSSEITTDDFFREKTGSCRHIAPLVTKLMEDRGEDAELMHGFLDMTSINEGEVRNGEVYILNHMWVRNDGRIVDPTLHVRKVDDIETARDMSQQPYLFYRRTQNFNFPGLHISQEPRRNTKTKVRSTTELDI